ncbi:Thylakoid lumenal protein TL20.3, chloroplastic [Glycine max]|nr:Thylakoid lumenal protein TL20.3, chloroplastic [Glycine max]
MALNSFSPLSVNSLHVSSISSSKISRSLSKSFPVVCQTNSNRDHRQGNVVSATLAAAIIAFSSDMSALADLNKFEAEMRGEFGIGSAAQKAVHVNENFRANFTAADMRESDFSGSTFNGAYLEKAVAYKANFPGVDLSDTLTDRMVLNEANLSNAILLRTVLTRSDLGGAIIEGADFSDAVLDLPQKHALCKYVTRVSTRVSLGCGNKRRNAYG